MKDNDEDPEEDTLIPWNCPEPGPKEQIVSWVLAAVEVAVFVGLAVIFILIVI
jgi:hypothetical protein